MYNNVSRILEGHAPSWPAILVAAVLCFGGCVSSPPNIPPRYQLGISEAAAAIDPRGVVLIGSSSTSKKDADGNIYLIEWFAMTNSNSAATNDERVIAANADLATNIWPKYRCHIDLSIDGGASWGRRIGYGVQTPKRGGGSETIWSPPDDYSLLTTNAVLRMTDLDGGLIIGTRTGAPYDLNPTVGLRSPVFAICGSVIDSLAENEILYAGSTISLGWKQVGGGEAANLYWLTPGSTGDDDTHFVATLSNVVNGANTHNVIITTNIPPSPQIRFAVRGVQYPSIIGYSRTFILDP